MMNSGCIQPQLSLWLVFTAFSHAVQTHQRMHLQYILGFPTRRDKCFFFVPGQRDDRTRSKFCHSMDRDEILMACPVPPWNEAGRDYDSLSRPIPRKKIRKVKSALIF